MVEVKALIVKVKGLVQGVGFRPFVYRLAVSLGLKGYVRNMGGSEVEILIEGPKAGLREFLNKLRKEAPPPALIDEVKVEETVPKGLKTFRIERSGKEVKLISMIPPDIGICEECLKEVLDPKSRWFNYPFNSCAWCGPRFTIMEGIPYDRDKTSMRDFPLCESCLREYEDPSNLRRFHAQGISCPLCGPSLKLLDREGNEVEGDPLTIAATLIDEGNIVAVKGLGGFHLAALASDDEVVAKLRKRKNRPSKPFALMALNLEVVRKIALVGEEAEALLTSPQRPIVVLPRRPNSFVSKLIAPGLSTIGVMLPYTALHYLLLSKLRDRLAIMTSGNRRGKPIIKDERKAFKELKEVADYFLVHNRRIVNRCDDSVIRFTRGKPSFLRRSRGYVPLWVEVNGEFSRPVICLGASTSTAASLAIGKYVILTQYIGDVEDLESLSFLREALSFLLKSYKVNLRDAIIVVDLHPSYLSTRLGEELAKEHGTELIRVQHHYAHVASVMAERRVEESMGIAIDGAGYGIDGRIWGGEIIYVKEDSFERVGHLKYHLMPGGDWATKYPVRMLVSILRTFLSEEEVIKLMRKRGLIKGLKYGEEELEVCLRQVELGRGPFTSSTGRVLDSLSALLKICFERTYEGEPAILLEEYSRGGRLIEGVEFPLRREGGEWIIDTSRAFESVLDLLDSEDPKSIALTFQYRLGEALGEVVLKEGKELGSARIPVSGGCAVNDYIIKGISDKLEEGGFEVILNEKIPPGDGGIALGQAFVALKRSGREA
ncbi:MAG: carbamoyltransferase HypF [Thermofilum sp. ex4484_15]|nr:MAG: carbamoyltransferase HypF [Thermofilum sp. ex4484_15]